ncbi:MAG: aminopeptidase P N-terminal domain-containing protein [Pyrinomonadaceae bacterium]|nr:aminopeptidase P N-terminal domain-containing protein [Pyrinomonadaceae bacterium]
MIRSQLEKFTSQIGDDAIAIIPAAREVIRSFDTEFKFRQDSDFAYLTGFPEPDAIAVINPSHATDKFVLFVRPRNPLLETWNGKRFGVEGASEKFGANKAFDIADFQKEIGARLNGKEKLIYRFGVNNDLDATILQCFKDFRLRGRKGFYAPTTIIDPSIYLHESRLIKTADEIELMRQSAEIAVEAHIEAMKFTKPNMNEFEVEALLEYVFKRRGASGNAYNSIVGGGANATILHYVENNAVLKDGDLLLIDAGADFKGYASDITSTFPVNGKFTTAQRELYELVLSTERACLKETRAGVSVKERQDLSIKMLTEGMLRLGILTGDFDKIIAEKTYERFYMHGVGHFLGLDVHDAGRYFTDTKGESSSKFEAGMVVTVEPGIYIPENAENVPDKYRGIGIRLEDDILVTQDGNENLTARCPKEIEEIEEIMAK